MVNFVIINFIIGLFAIKANSKGIDDFIVNTDEILVVVIIVVIEIIIRSIRKFNAS